MTKAEQLAELVLIYFRAEELHPDEEKETEDEMLALARYVQRENSSVCLDCNGTGERLADGVDSMGLPRWGHEMLDNRDRRCFNCRGKGNV